MGSPGKFEVDGGLAATIAGGRAAVASGLPPWNGSPHVLDLDGADQPLVGLAMELEMDQAIVARVVGVARMVVAETRAHRAADRFPQPDPVPSRRAAQLHSQVNRAVR